jgi:hypothetical protein
VAFLEQLATISSGRFYFTNDMFTLPQIFAQESAVVQRHYITEETFAPVVKQPEPLLSGITKLPELDGYVATSAKTFATVSLTSHRDDPVLAFWRHGLGQTVAYTSDPVGAWGAKWRAWTEWERFWTQTARYLARTNEPANFQVSVDATGNSTTVIVDTLDSDVPAENEWTGALIDATGQEHRLAFSRSSYGRYEAQVPVTGTLFGKVFRIQGDTILEEAIVQFSAERNREYELSGSGKEYLKQITGGRLIESVEQMRLNSKTASDVQPVRRQLLLWALWLFLLDVLFRKLDPSLFRRSKAPQAVPLTAGAPLTALKVRKTQIEQHRPVMIEIEDLPVDQTPPSSEPPPAVDSDYMQRLKEAKSKTKR